MAVMPLTMSLEILAEAASALRSGRPVVGLRDVRAARWITFDRPQTLQVTARARPGDQGFVDVQLHNVTPDLPVEERSAGPVVAATVVLAGSYPKSPAGGPINPSDGRPSRLRPDQLYTEAMFHGPCWRGVSAIERTADDGSTARLRILPADGMLRGEPAPRFALDPVTLDAAGQVIGFWTMEHLDTGRIVFPYRLEALDIHGPRPPDGASVDCVASIRLIGQHQVRSDIDVLAPDGRPWMRLSGWEDKRFDLPANFISLMAPSRRTAVSEPWQTPTERLNAAGAFACRRIAANLPSDRGFWVGVWANRVLGRVEREAFRNLRAPERRRLEWLAGRTAAKEAVRDLLRSHCGLDPTLADIEIRPDDRGCPRVVLGWPGAAAVEPVVSIAHSRGVAVALAGLPIEGGGPLGLGVDLERLRPLTEGFIDAAFGDAERRLIRDLGPGQFDEWLLRAWCAKEAVGKATGAGLVEGPRSVEIAAIDAPRGIVAARLAGRLAREHPRLDGIDLLAWTDRVDDLIVATSLGSPAGAGSVGVGPLSGAPRATFEGRVNWEGQLR